MLIRCTKKLLDKLNIKPGENIEGDSLFSWHANLITMNRRKTVVLVNDKNRYIIVLYGLKAKDFKGLDDHIRQAIRETFQEEGIKDEIINKYINHSKDIYYTKTRDKKFVARMNKACETVHYFGDYILEGRINQSALNFEVSRLLVGSGSHEYIKPHRELYKDLEVFAGQPVIGCKALELKVTLDLNKHNIWRRIVVPAHMTFNRLHKVLQVAFGWKDYHLHEFFVYSDEKIDNDLSINHPGYHKEGYKPVVNLVCSQESLLEFENDIPVKLEKGIRLSDYMPAKMKYNYDYGDNWQHYIEVEKVIEESDRNYPFCLEGEGNSPPEDVGGEQGFEEFLKIIKDEKHPEHEEMVNWGRWQGYEEFNIDMVNRLLKNK